MYVCMRERGGAKRGRGIRRKERKREEVERERRKDIGRDRE